MLSRLRRGGIIKLSQSLAISPLPIALTTWHQIAFQHTPSVSNEGGGAASSASTTATTTTKPLEREMRRPILTGRRADDEGRKWEEELVEEYPNPFVGKELPYGRKVIFDCDMEEDLARGQHWHSWNDRFMQWLDHDFMDRGWSNFDLYKAPLAKRGCDDITMSHDMDYHYRVHNIGAHLQIARCIPHLRPLLPELTQDFEAATIKWQDIVEDVLGDEEAKEEEREEVTESSEKTEEYESGTEYSKTVTKRTKTKIKVKKKVASRGVSGVGRTYRLNNMIREDRPLCGEDVIEMRRQKIKQQAHPEQHISRKDMVKREIELNTLKQFVDDKVNERSFVRLIFVDAMGTKYYVYGMVGETLLQCCRRYLIPIDGYCNGSDRGIVRIYGKGAWCHLCQMDISPKFFHLIPPFDWRERAAFVNFRHITPTSRLGCCIWIRPDFDGMSINIPVSIPNPYGRFHD
eukprot:CAMPEP_0197031754 /NCGR_PEP_ID=MMETSP1384-20130603/10653_1 /TAXON_ID=29189 /ORGANISM="Ammonia sp." /LENGTH=459 /DNA_ID=CAMNT_0042461325 /DNA_START=28 /DNA_END=1407 /DNA_ORIENTATION=+